MSRNPRHDILFEPVRIGPKTLKNRFFQVPHSNGFGTDRPASQARFRGMRAEGGWACVSDGITSIHPEADRANPGLGRLWDNDDVENLRAITEEVHRHDALFGLELFHSGPHNDNVGRMVPATPSGLPSEANPLRYGRSATVDDIREIQNWYVQAARRGLDAGVDLIYVYGSHGYLPLQFLSPFYNHRTDSYGGALADRAKFWIETLELVREAVGGKVATGVRIAVDARGPAGMELDESLEFIELADDLVDVWDVNIGNNSENWYDMAPSRLSQSGWQTHWTSQIRGATAKPIIGTGRYTDPDQMISVLRSGNFDLIGAARPSIADPFLPRKIEEGDYDGIRECIGCNYCLNRVLRVSQISCTQNPTAGEEYRQNWHPQNLPTPQGPTENPILIIGAGAAGLECAATLGQRGFEAVHLVDAHPEVGGYARTLSRLPGLGEWGRMIDWRVSQIERSPGVEIITGMNLGVQDILDYGAETVVFANGARWATDAVSPFTHQPVPGWDHPHVADPTTVLDDAQWGSGDKVLIYDCEGLALGVGLAEILLDRSADVSIVTPLENIGTQLDYTFDGYPVRRALLDRGARFYTEHELTAITPTACTLSSYGRSMQLEVDRVILLTSRQTNHELRHAVETDPSFAGSDITRVFSIGDVVSPRHIAECVYDGHELGRTIESPELLRQAPLRERPVVNRPFVIDLPTPIPVPAHS